MPEKTARAEILAFTAILLAALGLRAWILAGQSFTMDELYDLRLARCDVSEIVFRADGFPPLYALVLRGWLGVFGSDMAARWLSVLFGLGSIFFVWRLGRRIGGTATGLWSAVMLAVAPIHVYYSQEARAYGLYFFWTAAALWSFFRARENNRAGDWVVFAVACLGGLYTHYHFAVLVVVLGGLWVTGARPQAASFVPLLAFAAVAVGGLPLLAIIGPDLALQVGYPGQTAFGAAQLGYTYYSFFSGFTLGPSLRELQTLSAGEAVRQSLPWLAVIGLATAPLAYRGARRLRENRRLAEWLVLLIAPVVVVGVLGDLAHVGYKVRYVVWVAIPLVLLLGAGCGKRKTRAKPQAAIWLLLCTFGLAAVFCVALYNRHYVDRYRNEDAAGVAAYLNAQNKARMPVFVISFYMADPVAYYLGDGWNVQFLPDVEAGGDNVMASLMPIDRGLPTGGGYWLVYSRPFHGDPKGTLKGRLTERDHLGLEATFAGIELYRGERGLGAGG